MAERQSRYLRIINSESVQNHGFLSGARKNTELMKLFQLRNSLWNVCQRRKKCCLYGGCKSFDLLQLLTDWVSHFSPGNMWLQQAVNNTFSQGSYSFTRWVFVGVKFSLRSDDTCSQWQHCLWVQSRVFFLSHFVSPAMDITANIILLSLSCFAVLKTG